MADGMNPLNSFKQDEHSNKMSKNNVQIAYFHHKTILLIFEKITTNSLNKIQHITYEAIQVLYNAFFIEIRHPHPLVMPIT